MQARIARAQLDRIPPSPRPRHVTASACAGTRARSRVNFLDLRQRTSTLAERELDTERRKGPGERAPQPGLDARTLDHVMAERIGEQSVSNEYSRSVPCVLV